MATQTVLKNISEDDCIVIEEESCEGCSYFHTCCVEGCCSHYRRLMDNNYNVLTKCAYYFMELDENGCYR